MKSNTCSTKNSNTCSTAETLLHGCQNVLIHVQPNYDTFMVKLSGKLVYMYGKRFGPL